MRKRRRTLKVLRLLLYGFPSGFGVLSRKTTKARPPFSEQERIFQAKPGLVLGEAKARPSESVRSSVLSCRFSRNGM